MIIWVLLFPVHDLLDPIRPCLLHYPPFTFLTVLCTFVISPFPKTPPTQFSISQPPPPAPSNPPTNFHSILFLYALLNFTLVQIYCRHGTAGSCSRIFVRGHRILRMGDLVHSKGRVVVFEDKFRYDFQNGIFQPHISNTDITSIYEHLPHAIPYPPYTLAPRTSRTSNYCERTPSHASETCSPLFLDRKSHIRKLPFSLPYRSIIIF